jgi:hypothetical protein
MGNFYIMKKNQSVLADLKDGGNIGFPIGHGNIYYVNGSGSGVAGAAVASDNNDGLTPKKPLSTILAALAKCVNDRGDIIYVTDYYQPSGESWPIVVDKSLVSIIGYQSFLGGPFALWTPWVVGVATGTNKAFMDIVANNVLIHGFGMYASDTGAPCVTMDEGIAGVQLDFCRFNQGTYGVHLTSGDTGYGIAITRCFFQNGLASGGIYFNDDPAHCLIAGNHFDRLAGPAISIVQGSGGRIIDNHIGLANGYAAGDGITLASGVNRYYVDGNRATLGNVAGSSGNNPYVDSGVATSQNNWGVNYYGVTLKQPS